MLCALRTPLGVTPAMSGIVDDNPQPAATVRDWLQRDDLDGMEALNPGHLVGRAAKHGGA
jgi:hypothetical protein